MPKRFSTKRIHKNRVYTAKEAANAIGGKEQTVQLWIWREGLLFVDGQIPRLIKGSELIRFIDRRNSRLKTKLAPLSFHCLKCRGATESGLGAVEIVNSAGSANLLRAICANCSGLVHRWVSAEGLSEFARKYAVTKNVGL